MKKTLIAATALALSTFGAQAATSSAYAYGDLYIEGYYEDPLFGEMDADLTITGDTNISISARAEGDNDTDSDRVDSMVSVTNNESVTAYLMIEMYGEVSADSNVPYGGPTREVYYDSNGYLELGFGSAFASTTGNYRCSEARDSHPFFNCYGDDQSGYDGTSDFFEIEIDAGETVNFNLSANVFATVRTTFLFPVPLPATAWMLLAGLGALGAMRRLKA